MKENKKIENGKTKATKTKLISELLADKNDIKHKLVSELDDIIDKAYENYKGAPAAETVIFYDVDMNDKPIRGGSVFVERDFSGCGFAHIVSKERRLNNVLKDMKLKKHRVTLDKHYYGGKSIIIDNMSYDNGKIHRLEKFYDYIVDYLVGLGFKKVYVYSRLD